MMCHKYKQFHYCYFLTCDYYVINEWNIDWLNNEYELCINMLYTITLYNLVVPTCSV